MEGNWGGNIGKEGHFIEMQKRRLLKSVTMRNLFVDGAICVCLYDARVGVYMCSYENMHVTAVKLESFTRAEYCIMDYCELPLFGLSTHRPTDRQTDRQTDTHTHTHKCEQFCLMKEGHLP